MQDIDRYQLESAVTMTQSVRELQPKEWFMYMALGLGGETGEVLEKIKKIVRDKDGHISPEDRDLLGKELGDIMWYMARIADRIGIEMSTIVMMNLQKLSSRQQRGTLHGDGDNR